MTTGLDIVTGALTNLGVHGIGEALDTAEANFALTTLNDMAAAWEAMGVHTGWTAIALTGDFPLEDKHIEGVKWMLAGRLAPSYGKRLDPNALGMIALGWRMLQNDYKKIEPMSIDRALLTMPSQRHSWPETD